MSSPSQVLKELGGEVFLRSTQEAVAKSGRGEGVLFTVALTTEQLRFLETRLEGLKQYRRELFGDSVSGTIGDVLALLVDQYREETKE